MKLLIAVLLLISFTANAQITGHLQTYIGATSQLSDQKDTRFGTWTSSSPSIATVGSRTGLVTGVAQGTTKIYYAKSGVNDSVNFYVSTSDSSGYYFKTLINSYQIQKRDFDGVTPLVVWTGGAASSHAYQTSIINWDVANNTYTLIFTGYIAGSGNTYSLNIPSSKIKNFDGAAPFSTADSVISQIAKYNP